MKSFTLHDLPNEERPRERLKQYGVDALSSQELLALILGRGVQGESVMVTAQKLISHFGSLANLHEASFEDLCAMKGIGTAKACQLLACFELNRRIKNNYDLLLKNKSNKSLNFEAIIKLLQEKIGSNNREHFMVISLDSRQQVIAFDIVAIGTLNTNIVHPR